MYKCVATKEDFFLDPFVMISTFWERRLLQDTLRSINHSFEFNSPAAIAKVLNQSIPIIFSGAPDSDVLPQLFEWVTQIYLSGSEGMFEVLKPPIELLFVPFRFDKTQARVTECTQPWNFDYAVNGLYQVVRQPPCIAGLQIAGFSFSDCTHALAIQERFLEVLGQMDNLNGLQKNEVFSRLAETYYTLREGKWEQVAGYVTDFFVSSGVPQELENLYRIRETLQCFPEVEKVHGDAFAGVYTFSALSNILESRGRINGPGYISEVKLFANRVGHGPALKFVFPRSFAVVSKPSVNGVTC